MSRKSYGPGGTVKIANVNEDVSDSLVYPFSVRPYAQVVVGQTYRSLPALARDCVIAGDCGITHEIDEDQSGLDSVPDLDSSDSPIVRSSCDSPEMSTYLEMIGSLTIGQNLTGLGDLFTSAQLADPQWQAQVATMLELLD